MSSDHLLNPDESRGRSPAERILLALKLHGPQTAAALGKRLSISGEAARQQLVRLAEEGLVNSWSEARGVGRPSQFWGLTASGHAEFPDTHAELTVQLLRTIRQTLGDAAIDRVIAAREEDTRTGYRAALDGARSLRDRVEKLVRLRTAEGYMAGYEEADDGTFLFVENHSTAPPLPVARAFAVRRSISSATFSVATSRSSAPNIFSPARAVAPMS